MSVVKKMDRFEHRPTEVRAFQLTMENRNLIDAMDGLEAHRGGGFTVHTEEGPLGAKPGYWIVARDGEVWPVSDERFREMYQPAERGAEEEGVRDDEYRILEMFFDARRHYHDLYGYGEEEAGDAFVDWVDGVIGDYLDGRYEDSPHNPENSR